MSEDKNYLNMDLFAYHLEVLMMEKVLSLEDSFMTPKPFLKISLKPLSKAAKKRDENLNLALLTDLKAEESRELPLMLHIDTSLRQSENL